MNLPKPGFVCVIAVFAMVLSLSPTRAVAQDGRAIAGAIIGAAAAAAIVGSMHSQRAHAQPQRVAKPRRQHAPVARSHRQPSQNSYRASHNVSDPFAGAARTRPAHSSR